MKSAKLRAEAQFTATQKKSDKVLKEKERLRKERADQLIRLRNLRLKSEGSDKKGADPQ
tara:strand:+ start:2833 stop:3009 length:177 start_codon:yes stop_codon:yes gene_type:complete